ncbi:MAG: dihydrodipicolinate synthase family protein [Chloroflexota bacterium]
MNLSHYEGVFALLLTPFLSDGRIDWSCYVQYVDWQLSHQPHGLFAVCGSGEMHRLDFAERLALAKVAVQRAGSVPVVATANIAGDRTRHAQEMAQMADTGVAGLVLVVPDGVGKEQQQLQDYLAALAEQAPCPIILYEWPGVQPCHIPPDVYSALVADYGIRGIKDTTCTLEGIQAKVEAAPESIIYQANTPFLLDAFNLGARGTMAITSTAAADLSVRLWDAFTHKHGNAPLHHQQLVMLDAILRFGYPASAKYLARLRGMPFEPTCRTPSNLPKEGAKAISVWWEAIHGK